MAIDTIAAFLSVLRRVQLLAPEQVGELERELGSLYDDPQDLADYLVQIDWLTDFQCRALFEGDWHTLTLGPYQLLDRLGEGGVSEVFKAWDTVKGRPVALKVLRQNLTSQQEGMRQFQRELQAVTRLSHPNIIKTFDASQVAHLHYFAMEFVEGIDLHRFATTYGPLPIEQVCDYARQSSLGLQHAHQLGLIHRDIKPANLFLVNAPLPGKAPAAPGRRSPDPVVKVLDWGLARLMPQAGEGDAPAGDVSEREKGLLIGTADFVAPEQARDPTLVDTRADIYSLGCTLFFLLTGRPPFGGNSLMQKLLAHQEAEPPPLRSLRSDVPEELEEIVRKMLAKRPEDRFQIPLLVAAALRRYCPSAQGAAGSLIRSTAVLSVAPKPSTMPALGLPPTPATKPSSSAVLSRPGSSANLHPPASSIDLSRPGTR